MWDGDDSGGGGNPPPPQPQIPPGCSASWPWMCNNDPPDEPEDPDEILEEVSGTGGAAPGSRWCGNYWCPGDILLDRWNAPQDARIFAWSFMFGLGASWFVAGGVDVVWTAHGLVVFMEEPVYLDASKGRPYSSSHNFFLPIAMGTSLTFGDVTSAHIRANPNTQHIIEAWRGYAIQEGGSIGPVALNGSSSADSAGNPNFQTTSTTLGWSGGLPLDIHQYITNAVPYFEFNW